MNFDKNLIKARFAEDLPQVADLETLRTLPEETQKILRTLMLSAYAAGYTRAKIDGPLFEAQA